MDGGKKDWVRIVFKPLVFLLCLLPLGFLAFKAFTDNLSANPISDITNETGVWTLRFLIITLSVTPLRRISGWSFLQRFRRMFGLFAFLYVSVHFTTYIYLDKFFDWAEMLRDIAKRPFITVGFTAFTLLIPLAVTSFDSLMKWMGGRRWRRLHSTIYFCAVLGVIHYLWLVKADTQRPIIYGIFVLLLLGYRVWVYFSAKGKKARLIKTHRSFPADSDYVQSLSNELNS
jgi:methionine sulfoxide reductase heme-binding subunit